MAASSSVYGFLRVKLNLINAVIVLHNVSDDGHNVALDLPTTDFMCKTSISVPY